MTPLETAFVFVGIPLLICAVTAALVYGTSGRRAPRYRPGRPFDVAPVWFVGASADVPGGRTAEQTLGGPVLEGMPQPSAIEAGHGPGRGTPAVEQPTTAAAASTSVPAAAATAATGHRGGARGTW